MMAITLLAKSQNFTYKLLHLYQFSFKGKKKTAYQRDFKKLYEWQRVAVLQVLLTTPWFHLYIMRVELILSSKKLEKKS